MIVRVLMWCQEIKLIIKLKWWSKTLLARRGSQFNPPWKLNGANPPRGKYQSCSSLGQISDVSNQAAVFDVEGALLKSSAIFPYFMLVAFEAGGLLRALILFLLYPFVCLVSEEFGMKLMVFVCFFAIKRKNFRVGRAVLPKFLLEDVGNEGFDMVMKFRRKIGVTNLPSVMVEDFLVEYLGVDAVLGRELKVVFGYFVGLMEEKKSGEIVLNKIFGEEKLDSSVIGITSLKKSIDQQLLSHCKVVYLISETEKRSWNVLPRKKYLKPLIFHDGRLAFKPTFIATLEMFTWLPFGIFLFIIRLSVALFLPNNLQVPILSFTGMTGTTQSTPIENSNITSKTNTRKKLKGTLYVCNHRTLLDPIYVSMAIRKPVIAVTYSLSRITELLAPIKTVRLTRNREKDSEMMEKLLSQSDLVVCPEGTTCREPYLLRFSPLFAELTDEIVPVALDYQVSMFYGTTAGGYKFLDPVFLLLNPTTSCIVKAQKKLPKECSCGVGGKTKFEVANYVQSKIAEALGFECTNLTRKDKYIILAGNEGKV
ncbi:probable glycerol-3-phosphate acyltransferase 3 [Cannabis sativa]|uniref:probable glycerol-3-phosphate acyltransferase 3 n=1 Tax=Cannabis sativa TaxID=3483 RepID=UPI0011DF001D|nr:probable glycerol-3-phosphate acyltransferase 3 [Cannabis sativa]